MSCFQSAENITQWQTSHFKCLWNPSGLHSDFLNCFKIHILIKKDGKFGISRKHSTASGPNQGFLRYWREKRPFLQEMESNQLLRTLLGKPNHYADQNPRQFNHSLLTSATALWSCLVGRNSFTYALPNHCISQSHSCILFPLISPILNVART